MNTNFKKHQNSTNSDIFGFIPYPWLLSKIYSNAQNINTNKPIIQGHIIFIGHSVNNDQTLKIIKKYLYDWQLELFKTQKKKEKFVFTQKDGFIWIIKPKLEEISSLEKFLAASEYKKAQHLAGETLSEVRNFKITNLKINFFESSKNEILGFLCGLEIGSYKFKNYWPSKNREKSKKSDNDNTDPLEKLHLEILNDINNELLTTAAYQGCALNLARHLINLPASVLTPQSYQEVVKNLFNNSKHIKINIWNEKELKKQNMNLMLAVGQGAQHPPCLIHISYAPSKNSNTTKQSGKSVAFIGKGITFDTGGLNLKASNFIRHMKKDMAGSAALVGLAFWLEHAKPFLKCDIYLGIAENAISSKSYHPGDIIVSRKGLSVEIDNTDAEGRLVMADIFDLAQDETLGNNPQYLIDIATLTGAMRIALGTDIGGFFANDDDLAQKILESGYESGDIMWRMPLFVEYEEYLKSSSADCANCSSKMGGAITAALFLKKFIKQPEIKWAHFDIYAYQEKAKGPFTEEGASAQGLLCLINLLNKI